MKVIVLKVKGAKNLEEVQGVIGQGRTFDGGLGGWQMPKDAQPGDLAIWYAGVPDQEYRAPTAGFLAFLVSLRANWSSTTGRWQEARRLRVPVPRRVVGTASGFNEKTVGQLAETVYQRVDDFLLALGFDKRFVAARELISDEVARLLHSRS